MPCPRPIMSHRRPRLAVHHGSEEEDPTTPTAAAVSPSTPPTPSTPGRLSTVASAPSTPTTPTIASTADVSEVSTPTIGGSSTVDEEDHATNAPVDNAASPDVVSALALHFGKLPSLSDDDDDDDDDVLSSGAADEYYYGDVDAIHTDLLEVEDDLSARFPAPPLPEDDVSTIPLVFCRCCHAPMLQEDVARHLAGMQHAKNMKNVSNKVTGPMFVRDTKGGARWCEVCECRLHPEQVQHHLGSDSHRANAAARDDGGDGAAPTMDRAPMRTLRPLSVLNALVPPAPAAAPVAPAAPAAAAPAAAAAADAAAAAPALAPAAPAAAAPAAAAAAAHAAAAATSASVAGQQQRSPVASPLPTVVVLSLSPTNQVLQVLPAQSLPAPQQVVPITVAPRLADIRDAAGNTTKLFTAEGTLTSAALTYAALHGQLQLWATPQPQERSPGFWYFRGAVSTQEKCLRISVSDGTLIFARGATHVVVTPRVKVVVKIPQGVGATQASLRSWVITVYEHIAWIAAHFSALDPDTTPVTSCVVAVKSNAHGCDVAQFEVRRDVADAVKLQSMLRATTCQGADGRTHRLEVF